MTHLILDYSSATSSNRIYTDPDGRVTMFFKRPGWCPSCKAQAPIVHREGWTDCPYERDDPLWDECCEDHWNADVWSCKCGWWDIYCYGQTGRDSIDPAEVLPSKSRHAILRRYDPSDSEIPIEVLTFELMKEKNLIYDIHYKKMEMLVREILRGIFDCEVEHCGRSGDGGIDLIILNSDNPVAVQVKRRMKPDTTEPVSPVRELVAAAQLKRFSAALYVTNAESFSKNAVSEAQTAVDFGLLTRFELINAKRLFEMLKAHRKSKDEIWRKHLNHLKGGYY